MTPTPNILALLEKLRKNSHLGKHKHFSAADRCRHYNTYLGIPVVIINVLLGSLLFANLSEQIPTPMKWLGAFLALTAAVLSGLQTFLNFQKAFEAHRRVANQYLSIARDCERLIVLFQDNLIQLSDLAKKVEEVNEKYNKVNAEAEAFPTNNSDLQKATRIERAKVEELKSGQIRHNP
ncbi:MAG TPA: SLATT domain-containing protein [Coleofasciculaceae cyanobacterium]|jgi:hypothetical protein